MSCENGKPRGFPDCEKMWTVWGTCSCLTCCKCFTGIKFTPSNSDRLLPHNPELHEWMMAFSYIISYCLTDLQNDIFCFYLRLTQHPNFFYFYQICFAKQREAKTHPFRLFARNKQNTSKNSDYSFALQS